MYDIDELEAKWARYRRKRMIRRALFGMGILFLVGAPILYVTLKDSATASTTARTRTAHPNGIPPKRDAYAPAATKASPSSPAKVATVTPLAPTRPGMQKSSPPEPPKKPKMLITLTDRSAPKGNGTGTDAEKKIRMKMVDVKNTRVVKEIEARFPMTRDYDDAMYLAKYYYRKKRYRKAEYWAMQANTIDSTQEGSWIIFGKAKAKQGHRADALRILQAYYDRSGSMRVKVLIDRIRKGRPY